MLSLRLFNDEKGKHTSSLSLLFVKKIRLLIQFEQSYVFYCQ